LTDLAKPVVRSPKRAEALARKAAARLRGIAAATLTIPASTLNAAAVAVDTGYTPPAGHSAKLDGGLNVVDTTAHTTSSKNIAGSLRNFGGLAIAGAPTIAGTTGDATLATATVAFSVSGAGTLLATFTPPGAYVGTLTWLLTLIPTQNPP
jgi:hypothetical protein